ncbi:MFS general substrate transporter [Calocera cornea HHB12733]|uniref:MFS general substrate transporter n=1 Tax=Calocera cornea HHB12733 TaxID=1353952 RepID=A0A165E6P8_9BASI|nr:MFS general substrate transporter [Calocera cornea HHB12733]
MSSSPHRPAVERTDTAHAGAGAGSSTPFSPLSPSATVVDLPLSLSGPPTRVHSPSPPNASGGDGDGGEGELKLSSSRDSTSKPPLAPSDAPPSLILSGNAHADDESDAPVSSLQQGLLLTVFCMAQFLDAFNNSALFPALPVVGKSLGMSDTEQQWMFSAYQLTFSSFLLLSGRIADISSPKWTFISGVSLLSLVSLICGFVPNKIALIVLRAVQGIGAALTIPSALSLLVWTFPSDPVQSRAIAVFGGTGAVGNVLGLLIGAVFTGEVSYKWCFWFIPCLGVPAALVSAFFIPADARDEGDSFEDDVPGAGGNNNTNNKRSKGGLDFVGVSLLTVAMILFVFGITSGPTAGWGSAQVWAPVPLSIALLGCFLYWETRLPEKDAALPPALWFYPNFGVLFGLAVLPFGWWTASFISFTELWQDSYGLSSLETALHFLPLGFSAGTIITTLAFFPAAEHPKRVILAGFVLMIASSVLLPFARGMDNYWRLLFPAMLLGSAGASLVFVNCNIAIFRTTPKNRSGLTGAALNSALQLGCVITVAAVTGITTSVNERMPGDPYNGVSASFWWLLACTVLEAVLVAVFYKEGRDLFADKSKSEKTKRRERREREQAEREKAQA